MTVVRLDPDVLKALDGFIEHRTEPPQAAMTRTEAIETIVSDWLVGQGYLELPGDPSPITKALDAADVPENTSKER